MIDTLLQIVAPHHCSGCDKTGTLLCENCKNDITSDTFSLCISCAIFIPDKNGLCQHCQDLPYQRAWCAGSRQETLERLIDAYKFSYARQAARPLADILNETIPTLPPSTVVVPIPTLRSHIRQRGYDHIELVAKRFSKVRGHTYSPYLVRATKTQQKQATSQTRTQQAMQAFACAAILDSKVPYLLIDDVMTTGATLLFAAKKLQESGAKKIWIATISRQTLD